MYLVLFPKYFNSSLFEKFRGFLSIVQKFSLTIIITVITVKLFINLTVKYVSENLGRHSRSNFKYNKLS